MKTPKQIADRCRLHSNIGTIIGLPIMGFALVCLVFSVWPGESRSQQYFSGFVGFSLFAIPILCYARLNYCIAELGWSLSHLQTPDTVESRSESEER